MCKRLKRRIRMLGIVDFDAYRAYLDAHEAEWETFDALCRIPISRFYRDHGVFERLELETLPGLAEEVIARGGKPVIDIWSLGSASGEEPYTVSILWQMALARKFPHLAIDILATDSEPTMIERARRGCYGNGSLKELPQSWREAAFERLDDLLCIRPAYRACITFELADVRHKLPPGPFDLILCRNVIFTYFDGGLQRRYCRILHRLLRPGGVLVLGKHGRLPENAAELFFAVDRNVPIYRTRKAETQPPAPGTG
ncbi:MAG: methyltransferase domain-containing protein [Hyphomicrobiales bacterium]|nr:methyltransferase domain-containing protein [Hyphomicrobiales bacterium]